MTDVSVLLSLPRCLDEGSHFPLKETVWGAHILYLRGRGLVQADKVGPSSQGTSVPLINCHGPTHDKTSPKPQQSGTRQRVVCALVFSLIVRVCPILFTLQNYIGSWLCRSSGFAALEGYLR